jgi:hypothetical protein
MRRSVFTSFIERSFLVHAAPPGRDGEIFRAPDGTGVTRSHGNPERRAA